MLMRILMFWRFLYSIYFHLAKTLVIIFFGGSIILVCSLLTLFFVPRPIRETVSYHMGVAWGSTILFLSGIRVQFYNEAALEPGKHYVFAGNHQSSFDIYLFFKYLPQSFRWIAKKELLYIPFLGWAMYFMGQVFVPRSDSQKAAFALKKALEKIKAGISIAIFPEGTRSPDGNLLPFKPGAFALARLSRLDIVPVVIKNAHRVAPKGKFVLDPRVKVELKILKTLSHKDKEAAEKVRDYYLEELKQK